MSVLAPLLEAFFTERLIGQRHASPHTVAAYRDTWCLLLRFAERTTGRKPHQMGLETGLRVSELTGLTCGAVQLGSGAHVRCLGKGRKERITPLRREARTVLKAWLRERAGTASDALFPGPRGEQLSRDAVRRLVQRHVVAAAPACPSLTAKAVTPHTLRHSCAMNLLRHGVDAATIALWLGHEDVRTTYSVYLHADLDLKEKAIAKTAPPRTRPGRYRPPDNLLAFLEAL